jgi:hypothetical protein
MIPRVLVAVLGAIVIVACATIDPPASFTPNEAGAGSSSGETRTCRVIPRTFTGDTTAKLYGAPGGPQAVCVTLKVEVITGATNALVTFCVAGNDLDTAVRQTPRDIDLNPNKCAYCVDVQTNCPTTDGGIIPPCGTSYAPTAGTMRILKLGKNIGDDVWIDVGALVVARVEVLDRDAGTFELQPADCLSADGLTFQGRLVAATCTDDSTECSIANSASSRFP